MSSPYSEGSKVRSAPLKGAPAIEDEYNRVGLALAIFAALCFFVALWCLNGYFTARTVYSLGLNFSIATLSWGTGWLTHIVVSLIEQHLWRLRTSLENMPRFVLLGIYALIILVGVIDVLTSSLAFLLLFNSMGLSPTEPTLRFACVVLAETIAILPEPVIVWLAVALWRVVTD